MISGTAMAREIEEVSETFEETLAELKDSVAEDKRANFSEEKSDALKAFKQQRRIAVQLEGEIKSAPAPKLVPPASTHIDKLILFFNGGLDDPRRNKLRAVRNDSEQVYRKLQLLRPASEQDFIASVYWLSQRGRDKELNLLFKARTHPPFSSREIVQALDSAGQSIIRRRWENIVTFLGVSPSQFMKIIESTLDKCQSVTSPHLQKACDADRPTQVVRRLREIKNILEDRFEPSRIGRWLGTPLELFDGKSPREALLEGQTFPVLHLLKRLDEGTHY